MLRRLIAALLLSLLWWEPVAAQLMITPSGSLSVANTWTALQTFSSGIVGSPIIGGTGTTSTLTLQSTSGVGTTGADIIFKVGNNGSVEAGRIRNDGNVGIGTTGPSEHLSIEGSGNQELSIYSTDTGVSNTQKTFIKLFGENTSATKIEQARISSAPGATASTAGQLIFSTNNTSNVLTERMRVNEDGNVGIGTTSPGYKIHLSDATSAGIFAESGTRSIKFNAYAGDWNYNISLGAPYLLGTQDAQHFYIYTNNAAKMTVLSGGNVGIGTSAPASLLDLRAGDLTFSGANGQKYVQGRATQLVAVGSGISTKETTIQIPEDAVVYAVPVRVKTQPGGTSTVTVTATTSGTAFQKGASISTVAGTTDPGTKNTPVNYNSVAAQTVTLTFDAPTSDALGEVRIDIYYATSTPPTS